MNYILSLAIILVIIWFFKYTKNKKNFLYFKSKICNCNYNRSASIISYIFLLISIFLAAYVFINSFFNKKENVNKIPSKTNIVFVLDVSKSMNTIDIKYKNKLTTRLNLAKRAIKNYVLKHPYYKYGLVIFAGQAQTILPLTDDQNVFLNFLEGVDYRNLTKQGTNFSDAIKFAIDRFKLYKGSKYLVIISDGGDPGDYKGIDVSIPKKIQTFVFGVGSKIGGKIFLGTNDFGEPIFQTYRGNYVITKLDENNLKALANDTNGKYFHLDSIQKLNILDNYIKDSNNKSEISNTKTRNKISVNPLELMSLICFLLSLSIKIFFEQKNNLELTKIKGKSLA